MRVATKKTIAIARRLSTIRNVDGIFIIANRTFAQQVMQNELQKVKRIYFETCLVKSLALKAYKNLPRVVVPYAFSTQLVSSVTKPHTLFLRRLYLTLVWRQEVNNIDRRWSLSSYQDKIIASGSVSEMLQAGNDEAPQFQDPETAGCSIVQKVG
jgi:hypothetical protein